MELNDATAARNAAPVSDHSNHSGASTDRMKAADTLKKKKEPLELLIHAIAGVEHKQHNGSDCAGKHAGGLSVTNDGITSKPAGRSNSCLTQGSKHPNTSSVDGDNISRSLTHSSAPSPWSAAAETGVIPHSTNAPPSALDMLQALSSAAHFSAASTPINPSPAVAALMLQVAMATASPQGQLHMAEQPKQLHNQRQPVGTVGGPPSTVACRARGMPPEHNYTTAHFEIPPDVAHGQELLCSYPACRVAGVKFRFCTFCHIPVAKRNFRMRHNHCDEIGVFPGSAAPICSPTVSPPTASAKNDSGGMEKAEGIGLLTSGPASAGHPSKKSESIHKEPMEVNVRKQAKKRHSDTIDGSNPESEVQVKKKRSDDASSSSPPSNEQQNADKGVAPRRNCDVNRHRRRHRHRHQHVHDSHHNGDGNGADDNQDSQHHQEQQQLPLCRRDDAVGRSSQNNFVCERRLRRWAELFNERPSNGRGKAMSNWLMRVMAVSNLSAPLPSAAAAAISDGQSSDSTFG